MSPAALVVLGIFLCVAGVGLVLTACYIYREDSREIELLEGLLQKALEGELDESAYDETRLSRLESRFARFLRGSALARRQMEKDQEIIKELIGDISHQTKTPLSNILLYTQLLGETEMNPIQQELAGQIAFHGEKLKWLIQSLVKMSRLENELIQVRTQPQPVYPMLKEVLDEIQPVAQKKNVCLSVDFPDSEKNGGGGHLVLADKKWTVEALHNLVDNAVKYTHSGGKVSVFVRSYEMFLRIDIQDTGMGIAKEEQAKIFGRFYRGVDAGELEGVGVGLYLARQIITQEGGYIRVESELREGALFSVYLRRAG